MGLGDDVRCCRRSGLRRRRRSLTIRSARCCAPARTTKRSCGSCAIVVTRPDDLDAKELLFDAFFQKRDWPPALALAEELARRRPDVARLQKALIATLSNMKRYDETIVKAAQYIERHGEELTMLDALKVANFYTGKIDEAIRYGQRGIELRDAEAAKIPRVMTMTEPRGPPSGDNVISFSLWGPAPFYGYGAMINLVLSRTVYPGWICRFYVDATVPQPASPICATTAPTCARSKTNIPASACSSAFW